MTFAAKPIGEKDYPMLSRVVESYMRRDLQLLRIAGED